MATFDFISDGQLRASLEADNSEVLACSQAKAWKAVHVLVGSIVEAVLADYLISTDYKSRKKADPLNMDLGQLIGACKDEGVLSDKTVQLSNAIKSYRNLIHPGRTIRLGETADEDGATVARALLEILVREVSARKREKLGYTAEQIVSKLERDASAMGILPHLLKDMIDYERDRLILTVLPRRYFEIDEQWQSQAEFGDYSYFHQRMERLSKCFRSALALASYDTKTKAVAQLVRTLKEEHEHKVLAYETAFFKAEDLQYLSEPERALVKGHLLSRLNKEVDLPLLKAMEGLEAFLDPGEMDGIVDPLIRFILNEEDQEIRRAARDYLVDLWNKLPGGGDSAADKLVRRLDDWIKHFENQGRKEQAQIVRDIREACDLPF